MTGYAFVPLPAQVARRRRDEARLDRRVPGTFSGSLDVSLTCEQAVHIGAGFKRLTTVGDRQAVVRTGARVLGRLGIPGATFKGVIRSRFEAVTYSCVAGGLPRGRGETVSNTFGRTSPTFAPTVEGLAVFDRGCRPSDLCPACALFGRMSQSSRVFVGDLAQDEPGLEIAEMPAQFGPRHHHLGPYRRTGTSRDDEALLSIDALHGRKFSVGMGPVSENAASQLVEAIPRSTVLAGRIGLRNVTAAELGGLLTALGVNPSSRLKIGAAKGYGFGRATARIRALALATTDGTPVTAIPPDWRSAFSTAGDRFEDGEKALVCIHDARC